VDKLDMALRSPDFRRATFIGTILLVSYGYFFSTGGWNESVRLDLTRAIVEEHTLAIDSYHQNTGDKSFYNGHYYNDKAPGVSFLAVPVYWVAHATSRSAHRFYHNARYVANLLAIALPTALAAAAIYLWAVSVGYSADAGVFAALAFGLATPIWGYATVMWGHAPCGAFLLFAVLAAHRLQIFRSNAVDIRLGLAIGLCAGWATVTEYPAAVPAIFIALLGIFLGRGGGLPRIGRVGLGIVVGAVPCALLLGWYHTACFGSPWKTGYQYEVIFADAMNTGYAGLTHPKLDALVQLMFVPYRGLLPISPILAAAIVGIALLLTRRNTAAVGAASAFTFIFYLLMNASFIAWDGGGGIGPRYLGPTLALLCVGLVPAWARGNRWIRAALIAASVFGVLAAAVSALNKSQTLDHVRFPVWTLAARMWSGTGEPPANYGSMLGLKGFATMLPLVLVWALLALAWCSQERKQSHARPLLPASHRAES
jgi:hypothetical protein